MANILVIDDDEPLLFTLEQLLLEAGHTVATAADGKAGEHLLKTEKFDLVLTDIYMPERDGLETIMEVRQDTPNIGLIGMSGEATLSKVCLELARKIGAHRTLAKPFSAGELIEAVNSVLARHQSA